MNFHDDNDDDDDDNDSTRAIDLRKGQNISHSKSIKSKKYLLTKNYKRKEIINYYVCVINITLCIRIKVELFMFLALIIEIQYIFSFSFCCYKALIIDGGFLYNLIKL